jgi:hypothetical protein
MPRTTVNIDAPVLRDLKRLQKEEGKSLGRLMSDLLAEALGRLRREKPAASPRLEWKSRPMKARVDLTDKEAVRAALEREK